MTAPELDDLGRPLLQMESGISLLQSLAAKLCENPDTVFEGDQFHYLAHALKRDLKDALAWHDEVDKQNMAAREIGPRAVS